MSERQAGINRQARAAGLTGQRPGARATHIAGNPYVPIW